MRPVRTFFAVVVVLGCSSIAAWAGAPPRIVSSSCGKVIAVPGNTIPVTLPTSRLTAGACNISICNKPEPNRLERGNSRRLP